MKHLRFTLAILCCSLAIPSLAAAQSVRSHPELPALSPAAEVYQRVGITDVRLTYSSPARRGREIWGGLVPYGEVWRAGANAPTRLNVSNDFTFGGTPVPAGEYSLYILPQADSWRFILNSDSSGSGAQEYVEAENVATADVTPATGLDRERMIFLFDNTTDNGTVLTLEWAGLQGGVPIEIDTPAIAREGIERNLAEVWRPHFNAARYYLESGQDLDQAEQWMARSIEIEESWWNRWFMARIQAERGQHAAAREHVARAMELGAGDETWENVFRPQAEEAMASWPQ